MLKRKILLAYAVLALLTCGMRPDILAAERKSGQQVVAAGKGDKTPARKKKGLRGSAWAFGQSCDRDSAIWRQGASVRNLQARAVGGKKAMNTTPGIDNALSAASRNNNKKSRNGLGFRVENEVSTWRERQPAERARPDECPPLEKRHVVRAFADVEAGDDLSISVGPELILKEEQNRERNAGNNQPDSALGLGMQFKFDF